MNFLVDTNVVSEIARPRPDRAVLGWFESVADHTLYLSVLSIGEIRKGVEKLPDGKRRKELKVWLEEALPAWFGPRLLPVDRAVADQWGTLMAASARPLPAIDSLLAATALTHGLVIVTRNVADFAVAGLKVLNPWQAP